MRSEKTRRVPRVVRRGLDGQEFEQGRSARGIGVGLKSTVGPRLGRVQPEECSSEGTNNNGEGGEEIPRVLRDHLPGGVGGAERRKGGHRTSVPLTHVRAQAPGCHW